MGDTAFDRTVKADLKWVAGQTHVTRVLSFYDGSGQAFVFADAGVGRQVAGGNR